MTNKKVWFITGASRGMGVDFVKAALAAGHAVVGTGRDPDVVAKAVGDLDDLQVVKLDVTSPADAEAAVRAAVDRFGRIDVLVNNAGISWFGPTEKLDVVTFDRLFAANVRAAYFLVAALAPKMAARGSGSIINMSSMAGQIGLVGGAAYGATKAALASMTRSWAAEYSPAGVRVNAIAPGPVYTAASPDRIEALGETTLLARAAQPGEIANVIVFLASPKASYVTAATFTADGRRTTI